VVVEVGEVEVVEGEEGELEDLLVVSGDEGLTSDEEEVNCNWESNKKQNKKRRATDKKG
jgi:hypothetical protein